MQHKLEVFRQMLAIGSYAQLRALFDAYEKSAVSSLEDLIRKAFPEDDNVQALIALARTIHHPRSTFATNLRHYYDKDVKVIFKEVEREDGRGETANSAHNGPRVSPVRLGVARGL